MFRRLSLFLLYLSYVALPSLCRAGSIIPSIDNGGRVQQPGFTTTESNNQVIGRLWDSLINRLLLPLISSLAVLYLIYAGIQYITAGGNAEKTKRARQNIQNVLLGIIILVASYAIIGLAVSLFTYLAGQLQK